MNHLEQYQEWLDHLEDSNPLKHELYAIREDEKEIEEDEIPEKAETRCKLGDLWQLGRWVYCKKCGKKHYIH